MIFFGRQKMNISGITQTISWAKSFGSLTFPGPFRRKNRSPVSLACVTKYGLSVKPSGERAIAETPCCRAMDPLTMINKQTNNIIMTSACNFHFELKCRQTRKYANAFGIKDKNASTPPRSEEHTSELQSL